MTNVTSHDPNFRAMLNETPTTKVVWKLSDKSERDECGKIQLRTKSAGNSSYDQSTSHDRNFRAMLNETSTTKVLWKLSDNFRKR
jgi:predicted secreted protein